MAKLTRRSATENAANADALLLLSHVQKIISLSADEATLFTSCLESKVVKKRTVLTREGEVCRSSLFVVDGALKSYLYDGQKDEHVVSFALSGWWIADMQSLIYQKPGKLLIESIADSRLLSLSKEKQEMLYKEIPQFERFFRIITEKALVASQQRIINNLTLTAEDRYLHFMEKYPFVLECAPLHNIASYLGMTPEFLSKIRRRITSRAT